MGGSLQSSQFLTSEKEEKSEFQRRRFRPEPVEEGRARMRYTTVDRRLLVSTRITRCSLASSQAVSLGQEVRQASRVSLQERSRRESLQQIQNESFDSLSRSRSSFYGIPDLLRSPHGHRYDVPPEAARIEAILGLVGHSEPIHLTCSCLC